MKIAVPGTRAALAADLAKLLHRDRPFGRIGAHQLAAARPVVSKERFPAHPSGTQPPPAP
jgi:hypothetical protein